MLLFNASSPYSLLHPLSFLTIWGSTTEKLVAALQEPPYLLTEEQTLLFLNWKLFRWNPYLEIVLSVFWADKGISSSNDFIYLHWITGDCLSGLKYGEATGKFDGVVEIGLILNTAESYINLNFAREVLPYSSSRSQVNELVSKISPTPPWVAFVNVYIHGPFGLVAQYAPPTSPIIWNAPDALTVLKSESNPEWISKTLIPNRGILPTLNTVEEAKASEGGVIISYTGRNESEKAFSIFSKDGSSQVMWPTPIPYSGYSGVACYKKCTKESKIKIWDNVLQRPVTWELTEKVELPPLRGKKRRYIL